MFIYVIAPVLARLDASIIQKEIVQGAIQAKETRSKHWPGFLSAPAFSSIGPAALQMLSTVTWMSESDFVHYRDASQSFGC